jgi:hypothetical protein
VLVAGGALASSVTARPVSSPISVVSVWAVGSRVTLVQHPNATVPKQHPSAAGLLTAAPNQLNVVTGTGDLGFKVEVRNTGTSKEMSVTVKLTIDRPTQGRPLVRQTTLGTIGPGESQTVTLSHVYPVPFAAQTKLIVAITGRPSVVYPVLFALPA